METARKFAAALSTAVAIGLLACSDESAGPPDPGALEVTVVSRGDSIPRVHQVVLDDGNPLEIEATGKLTVTGVLPGEHEVRLRPGGNCETVGPDSRSVRIRSGSIAAAGFEVLCLSTSGSIVASTITTGIAQDVDGYAVIVNGNREWPWPIGSTDSLRLTELVPGPHELELIDIAPNCRVSGDNPARLTVTAAAESRIEFRVSCFPELAGRIVFHREDAALTGARIVAIDADGSNAEDLGGGFDPDWSPDGRRIAYSGYTLNIEVMHSDGSERMAVTRDLAWDFEPAWSPDGTRIVFTSARTSYFTDIYVLGADGTELTRLTSGELHEWAPAWSPDGSRIAFTAWSSSATVNSIYVMEADGSNARYLGAGYRPMWSPDGSQIAFVNRVEGNEDIYVMESDGSNLARLTSHAASDTDPTWSPDGSWIAFATDREGSYDIHLLGVDSNGIGPIRITDFPADERGPSWTADVAP